MTRVVTRLSAAALAIGLGTAAPAFDVQSMSDAERAAFRAEVRAYLLDNPEVLMEAIQVLEERNAQAQASTDEDLVSTHAAALFDDGFSWVGGNPDGDVTLVEFIDYRCSYCRKAHDDVVKLVEQDGNIRLIVKEFPILGEESLLSSRFAIATRQIYGAAAYKMVHDALITLRGRVSPMALRQVAIKAELDADPILAQMESEDVTQELRTIRLLAEALQVNGTPTFVLGDEILRGYVPLEAMQEMVDATRDQG